MDNATLTPSPKKQKSNSAVFFAVVAVILAGASLGLNIYNHFNPQTRTYTISSGADGNSASFIETSIEAVASEVSPAVVSILTETRTTSWYGQDSTSNAAGTGMIVSKDGYILTNKHVISGASKINVVLSDGTTYTDVKAVGSDPLNDVAFLKIDGASELPTVKLGNSKTIIVGEQVIAIGNALGQYQNTVTSGIISGTGRTIIASDQSYSSYEYLYDLIQTDASINAGNSGGPLVNAAGEVIGINSAVSSSGENIGFAIPIGAVKGMLDNLLETGELKRSYLGIHYFNINADVAESFNLPVKAGAYIYSEKANSASAIGIRGIGDSSASAVIPGSPAEKAGVKDKDIIIAVNGYKIGTSFGIGTLLDEYKPGDKVDLLILRDGKEITLTATLGAYEQ